MNFCLLILFMFFIITMFIIINFEIQENFLSNTMIPLCKPGYKLGPKGICYNQNTCGLHYVFNPKSFNCMNYHNNKIIKPQNDTSHALCGAQYNLDPNKNLCIYKYY
jgi:hypothetical protein